jgi:putative phosphoribosyl transferase
VLSKRKTPARALRLSRDRSASAKDVAMAALFRDRREAGVALARRLAGLALADPVVLALPRGGVPVAVEVARELHAPLDLLLVRKIGAPMQPELAVAAIVDGAQHDLVIDEETLAWSGATREYVDAEAQRQLVEIERRRRLYLGAREPVEIAGRTAIVVDDGIATGTTVRAALKALRRRHPARLVLAVPVAPREAVAELGPEVDQLVCLETPQWFRAVGAHYDDFTQVEDDEVVALLAGA